LLPLLSTDRVSSAALAAVCRRLSAGRIFERIDLLLL
jgi:hypothetical protein